MKAVGLFGDGLGTAELPRPEPRQGKVLVRNYALDKTYGVDTLVTKTVLAGTKQPALLPVVP